MQTEDVPKVQTEDVPKVKAEDVAKVKSEEAQPVPVLQTASDDPQALRPLIISTSQAVSPFALIKIHSPPRFSPLL